MLRTLVLIAGSLSACGAPQAEPAREVLAEESDVDDVASPDAEDDPPNAPLVYIRFPKNSANVPGDAGPALDAVVAFLNDAPTVERLAVVGRASGDEIGPRNLTRARAEAVVRALAARGVPTDRLSSFGLSADDPLTADGAVDIAAERSVGFDLLVVNGERLLRFDGRRLAPAATVDPSSVVIIDEIVDVIFDKIYFADGSAEIREQSLDVVQGLVESIALEPRVERLACVGFAARDEPNPDALSLARAEAVCATLVELEVDPTRLESHGAGTRHPLTGPGTGRDYSSEHERRVEIHPFVEAGVRLMRWNGRMIERVGPPSEASDGDGTEAGAGGQAD